MKSEDASIRFIFWVIVIIGAGILLVAYGQRCSQRENFVPVKIIKDPPVERKLPEKVGDLNRNILQPWQGYDKFSLYSTYVWPGNPTRYPYTNTKYDDVMRDCSQNCFTHDNKGRCLMGCVMKGLKESLPPIRSIITK